MPCSGIPDPADIFNGYQDPADDPENPEPEVAIEDCTVVTDPDGTMWARFEVSMSNFNYNNDITLRWDTQAGTATPPAYYNNQVNRLLTIPAGQGRGLIEVQVFQPIGVVGEKNFFVNLSNPANCTIDDAQGKATVIYTSGGPIGTNPQASIQDGQVVGQTRARKARFSVVLSIASSTSTTLRYDTVNGAAQAGIHFTGVTNGSLVIPAGSPSGVIDINILNPTTYDGNYNFSVVISAPVNGTIGDNTGIIFVPFSSTEDPPPPPPDGGGGGDPANLSNYFGWPDNAAVVYNQTADCHYYYACTGFGSAGLMSGLYWKATGHIQRFDAKKLFTDAGGTICAPCRDNCPGFNPVRVMREMKSGNGVKQADSGQHRHIKSFSIIGDDTVSQRIKNIKRAVHANGVVGVGSKWKQKWNSCTKHNSPNGNDHVLADPTNLPPYFGHWYLISGWNNQRAGGAFQIQSSYGTGWGVGGRCWLPYSYITLGYDFYKLVY
jgi:Calx-beta domain